MASYITAGANKLRRAREYVTPTLKSSAFLERGVLTPEEFVRAGDELVYKCPTWCWESGDVKKRKSYLPADKQYLVTRNVPCPTRVSTLENSVSLLNEDTAQIEDECGDDWLVSRMISPEHQQKLLDEKLEEEFEMLDDDDNAACKTDSKDIALEETVKKLNIDDEEMEGEEQGDDDDEYADMEEFEEENIMQDEAVVASNANESKETKDDNLRKVRTYDLSITYDKYYQTPRVWMMGYVSSDSSQPLTGDQMLEDVMSDYANRTVTIDPHPHVGSPHASIHPCQHGAVMKTIVKNLIAGATTEQGDMKEPSVEMYLFIFLKFVSSIIPTITYDFTMDVTASTKK